MISTDKVGLSKKLTLSDQITDVFLSDKVSFSEKPHFICR